MRYLIYRISSNSLEKKRIDKFSKVELLSDTLAKFTGFYPIVIADNCSDEILEKIPSFNVEFLVTKLGNSRSMLFAIKHVLGIANPGDIIYFCEDDYWHENELSKYIDEGLMKFDYITLFDHPDKYMEFTDYHSPTRNGAFSEWTQVVRSAYLPRWWRLTGSTTMTFAANYNALKEDAWIFEFFLKRREIPPDMLIWHGITRARYKTNDFRARFRLFLATKLLSLGRKRKTLATLVPSGAAHLEPRAIPIGFRIPD